MRALALQSSGEDSSPPPDTGIYTIITLTVTITIIYYIILYYAIVYYSVLYYCKPEPTEASPSEHVIERSRHKYITTNKQNKHYD